LSPILALLLGSALFWHIRGLASAIARERAGQLAGAAVYLEKHASALEAFLNHPTAPAVLKAMLVRFSDVLNQREIVGELMHWAASDPFDHVPDNALLRSLTFAMADLRTQDEALSETFDRAVLAAVAGASLRWPETAALFDDAFPRLVTGSRRDVTIAMTMVHLEPKTSSGLPPSPALAPI
jgi:2-methylisocitrate lyase-like PEP mutase family enzyme